MNKMLIISNIKHSKPSQIFSKINFDKNTGCWLWKGSISKEGYGWTTYRHRTITIHRFIYAWLICPIPTGKGKDILVVDHLCNVRACCNPAHLALVLPRKNVMRTTAPPALNFKKELCLRGHKLSPRHILTGRRRCVECPKIVSRIKLLNLQ